VLRVGGYYSQDQDYGLFYLNGNNAASNSNGFIGSQPLLKSDCTSNYFSNYAYI
jgi:hypothetical protein